MDASTDLYEGRLVRLGPIDFEKDPEIVARWTHDPLLRALIGGIAHPMSAAAARKMLEGIGKKMEECKNLFHFTLRAKDDDRLIGLARLYQIDFHNGTGALNLGVGELRDRRHGYGSDALNLLMRFAFGELNLYRLSVWPDEANYPMIRLVERAGFEEETRRREAAFHSGEYWDVAHMGLLRSKWERKQ